MTRLCQIVEGTVEDATGGGDGAYDLLDVVGTPEDIGEAITEYLGVADLYSCRYPSHMEEGQELFLVLKIKFTEPAPVGQ